MYPCGWLHVAQGNIHVVVMHPSVLQALGSLTLLGTYIAMHSIIPIYVAYATMASAGPSALHSLVLLTEPPAAMEGKHTDDTLPRMPSTIVFQVTCQLDRL